jgi:hypothetical protein
VSLWRKVLAAYLLFAPIPALVVDALGINSEQSMWWLARLHALPLLPFTALGGLGIALLAYWLVALGAAVSLLRTGAVKAQIGG